MRRQLLLFPVLLLALVIGRGASAAMAPFDMVVTIEIAQGSAVELANVSGMLDVQAGDVLVVPSLPFGTAITVNIPFTDPPFIEGLVAFNMGIAGGTLAPVGNGFTGTVPLSGTLLVDLFDNLGLGNLSLPLSVGGSAFPSPVYTYRTTQTGTVSVSLSASFSPWFTSQTSITGLVDGATTTVIVTRGSRSTTPGGARNLNLIAPVRIFRAGTPDGSPIQTRVIPGLARMQLTVPEPTRLLLYGAAAGVIAVLGVWRSRRR